MDSETIDKLSMMYLNKQNLESLSPAELFKKYIKVREEIIEAAKNDGKTH